MRYRGRIQLRALSRKLFPSGMSKYDRKKQLNRFLRAASEGNLEEIKKLIADGVSVNAKDEDGETALLSAAAKDRAELVEYLLAEGARVNHSDRDGLTALLCTKPGSKSAEILIDHGANINKADKDGMTPLKYAAYDGDLEGAKLLINRGARINQRKGIEIFSIFIYLFPGYGQNINKAIEILDKSFSDNKNAPALQGRWTALIWALRRNHTDVAKLLIENGANIHIKYGFYRWTALYWAARQGQKDVVELLLKHGADPNAALRVEKFTPLFEAARRGYTEIVKLLIEYGTDINVETKNRQTPLIAAINEGHTDTARVLREAGAREDR